MKVGDRIVVIGDDLLNDATGTVTAVMDVGCIIDLDPELYPDDNVEGLYFELEEVEVI